jgi:hypothetical protein
VRQRFTRAWIRTIHPSSERGFDWALGFWERAVRKKSLNRQIENRQIAKSTAHARSAFGNARTPLRLLFPLVFGALAFVLFTQHRDFPFFYHSDESAKVEQVMTRDYNFHHPMLLLTATEQWLGDSEARQDPQRVVEAGRLVSALFSALAVAALVWLAMLRGGLLAAIAVGVLLAIHQQLLELAHYMKEDPALLLGIALTFLALEGYRRQPTAVMAMLVGAACGLAVSGKYLGAVAFACAVPVVLLTSPRRAAHLGVVLASAAVLFVVVNLPLLGDLAEFRASFDREVGLVVEGSKGMSRRVPHAIYLNIFADNTTPAIWLLLGVYYWQFWRRRREQDALAWIIALFPLVLTVAFSFSPKTNDRYYLPVTATFYYLAALGLTALAAKPRWAALALAVAIGLEIPRTLDVLRAFQHDDRRELADYIAAHLPPTARIVQDERVMLPSERNRKRGRIVRDLPQEVVAGKSYAAELGDLEKLRADGFTHVAVTESNYGRYFLDSMKPKDGAQDDYKQRRNFYERLFREGTLLFERPRGTVVYLHPGLRLYELGAK